MTDMQENLEKPEKKPKEGQARYESGLKIADADDTAIEINIGVVRVDGVDPASNHDLVPSVEESTEKANGGKPCQTVQKIPFLNRPQIDFLHLRNNGEEIGRRYTHNHRRYVNCVPKITEVTGEEI